MSYVTHTCSRSPRRARRAAGALLVALAAVTLVWMGEEIAAATRSISTQFAKADAVQTDIVDCNDSPGFRSMQQMLVSFKIAGSAPRPVIVLFAGEWFSNDTPPMQARIRLSIDGIPQPEQVVVATRFQQQPIETGTHGYNFVTDALAPGLHVAKIEWEVAGNQFCIGDRSLIVMHK